jgi:hypothetical protein
MSFREAIEQTPLLKLALKNGLQALRESNIIKPKDTQKCEGSVDIDTALEEKYPNVSRWDYAVGYDGRSYFIEIHPADTSEVKAVLNKLEWLKSFLRKDASELDKEPKSFHWIATGGVHITRGGREARQLAERGIDLLQKVLSL